MAKAMALIEEAAAILDADRFEGPHWQYGSGLLDELGDPGDPGDFMERPYFPFSPVAGRCNPIAPPAQLDVVTETVDGTEVKVVAGQVTLTEPYNGPPWNLAHGGVIACIFDEMLGISSMVGAGGGYTARLTIHYRAPTPLLEPLDLRAWVDRVVGRKIYARGAIKVNGHTTAEAEGLFIQSLGTLIDHPG